jgi:signal transduction histidine kinase/CheY-like chemotaxis protein
MLGTPTVPQAPPVDSSRSALEFIHRLLASAEGGPATPGDLLGGLAAAFGASAAGVATLPEGVPLCSHPASANPTPPWRDQPDLIERAHRTASALAVPQPGGGSYLLTIAGTPEHGGWLFWLEDGARAGWSDGEAAALALAGHALSRRLAAEQGLPRWAELLDHGVRQQRLETAARLVRRLAHDFGNILTGILGFSELALAQQLSPGSPLHAYLTEVYRGAQNGAQYTNQLRLFARRQATANNRSCSLAPALAEEETRLRPALGTDIVLTVDLSADLPPVGLESAYLRQVLGIVLDNAREAIRGAGAITVSAHTVELNAAEARQLFGDVRPGAYVEVWIADTGSGLTPEARRQLFTEPFFSTKPRSRGFGLAIAYGILSAHHGSIELVNRSEGGTLARLVLPVAAIAAPTVPVSRPPAASPSQPARASNEKILVVDDDPMILHFVTTSLQRAGFRVQAVSNAEDALQAYTGAGESFGLVLADVLMPNMNGIDLAKRLLAHDAGVRLLFMSGQVPAEIMQQAFGPERFDFLPKPFRPEGLVRAVRVALDRASPRRPEYDKVTG